MRESIFKIIDNAPLTQTVYKMKLQGDVSDITSSGQFVNIKLDGLYLRRPISVCDCENTFTFILSHISNTRSFTTDKSETAFPET